MDLWIIVNVIIWYTSIANFTRPEAAKITMPLLLVAAIANLFASIHNPFAAVLVIPSLIILKFYIEQRD